MQVPLVFICECIGVYVCVCVCVRACVRVYVRVCVDTNYTCANVCVHTLVCKYFVSVYVHVCTYK